MTCKQIQELFLDALYNELDVDHREAFEAHLTSCKNCSHEYAKMKEALSIMDKRTRTEPDQDYWDQYWSKLDARMKVDLSTSPAKSDMFRWRPAKIPAWAYGIAAMLLVAIGIYVGRTYFGNVHTAGVSESANIMPPPVLAPDSSTLEAMAYLERSKNLLIGLTNLDEQHHVSVDLSHHQKVSRELIERGNILTVALNKPDQQLLRQLVQDLQLILLQLANVEVAPGVPAIELVKKGVNEKSILLKINLEEMKAAARQSSPDKSGKKNTKSL